MYFVDGLAFSWGDKLSFQDMRGDELAFITQTMLSWKPTYEIQRSGRPFATLTKEFSWFSKEFKLDVPGPNDYEIEGRFWTHEYEIFRPGPRRQRRCVATVSKAYWAWTDTYGIEIADDEDDVSILCVVIAIDQVLHDQKK